MDQPGTGPIMMGTPLDKLDSAPMNSSDQDLVNQIFQDMQKPAALSNPVMSQNTGLHMSAPAPPAGARIPMVNNNQQQMMPHTPDPTVATAHMIGSAHPTQSDFQHMMMASNMYGAGMPPGYGPAPVAGYGAGPVIDAPKKNWNAIWVDELRQPFIVMIILFVITLPWFHLLTSHYAPHFLKPTGDFTTAGLLVRAALGGTLFWFLQRIVAPLIVL
jgi:hypothetical protein